MRRCIPLAFLALAVLGSGVARADHTLLVPRSDSSVDWGTRKLVEGAVLDLAQHIDRGASQTDAPFSDLAVATGCKGGVAKCKAAVLDAIDVDELVLITIAPAGAGQAKVTVRRASRTGLTEARVVVQTDDPDAALRAGLASLFGLSAREAAKAQPQSRNKARGSVTSGGSSTTVTPEKARAIATLDSRPDPTASTEPAAVGAADPAPVAEPDPAPAAAPSAAPPEPLLEAPTDPAPATDPAVTAAPANVVDDPAPSGHRRLYLGGVIAGGALIAIGVVLWTQASSIDGELRDAPDRTSADIQHLRDLESRGDQYAFWGNATFVVGVAVAGTGGFLLWRDSRRRGAAQARLVPALLDHGVGLTFAIGAGR